MQALDLQASARFANMANAAAAQLQQTVLACPCLRLLALRK